MTNLEQDYDIFFNQFNRNIDVIYREALARIYRYEFQYLIGIAENFAIQAPSDLSQRLKKLADEKRYSEIFGPSLGGEQSIFHAYGLLELKIDKLHVFVFAPVDLLKALSVDSTAMTEYIRRLRVGLGPLYPDKIKEYTVLFMNMRDPNGQQVRISTYDWSVANLFRQYSDWLNSHKENINSQFKSIAKELKAYLKEEYKIKPDKDGFAEWFIENKLQGAPKLTLPENDNNGLYLDFEMLKNELTPSVIEEDLHEYCRWRKSRYQEAGKIANKRAIEQTTQLKTQTHKRGPYKKPQQTKDDVINYFKSEVQDLIDRELRSNKQPDKDKIITSVRKKLLNKGYNDRTLRGYLPSQQQAQLFGEIYRQILEFKSLTNK